MRGKERWLSLAETAGRLGTTPLNVLMHLKRGDLRGEEQEGEWFVARDSLEGLLAGGGRRRAAVAGCSGCRPHGECQGHER